MPLGDLAGKHALVCGASQGIGRATAIKLAERGCIVTGLARSKDKLAGLMDDLQGLGVPGQALVADMEDRPGLERAVSGHLAKHGPLHILIHNTGGPPAGPVLEARDEDFLRAFSRHVLSAQLLLRLLLPGMREAGYGRIVNIISTSVREPIPNLGVSNVTRAAMASWAKTVSRELPPGITINSVLPGYTDTERLDELASTLAKRGGKSEEEIRKGWIGIVPEGRLGRPEEIGAVIAFLASPDASFVRGIVVPVDGGRMNAI